MPEDRAGMPLCPSRRGLLTFGVGSLAAMSLAACGIRLEDDAPRVPLIPTRRPIPGEGVLLSLWRDCDELAAQATALGGATTAVPARVAALHRSQVAVMAAQLLRLGVPQKVLDEATAAPTTSASATTPAPSPSSPSAGRPTSTATGPSTPAPPLSGPKGLADAETAAITPSTFRSLAAAPEAAIPLFAAALAQRTAAAALLGALVTWPAPTWSGPSLAASFLESTRAAVYAFEVVAAQSPTGAQGTLAADTLAALEARAQAQELLAGASAGPPALAYPLPTAVATPAAARTLANQVLTDLRAAVARDLGSAGRGAGPLGSVVQWLAETEVLASRWGVPLAPFPGLR